jgi:hypothetical protein
MGNVSGLFYVSMEVLDAAGAVLTQIDAGVAVARHVVHVENISTLPRDARVNASLPHGTAHIEFVISAAAKPKWKRSVSRIPSGQTRDLECDLRRNSGAAHKNEPIQCDEVFEKRGRLSWRNLPSGVPFQITIDAI